MPALALPALLLLLLLASAAPAIASPEAPPKIPPAAAAAALVRDYCADIPPIASAEYAIRRENLRWLLAESGAEAFVAEPGHTTTYLTAFSWSLSERPLLLVVVRESDDVFWIAPQFEEASLREALGDDARMFFWEEDESPYALLGDILRATGRSAAGPVLLDPEARFFIADGLGALHPLSSGAEAVRALRMVKSPAEEALLDCSERAAKASIAAAAQVVELGMRESEIEPIVHEALRAAGLTNTWAIALNGPNAAFPHGTGQQRPLQDGDLVLIDAGGLLHGYQSDCTRTFPVGNVPDDARRVWDAVRAAQDAAIDIIRPGVTLGELDAAARQVIEDAGYGADYTYFGHRLGHGIGLSIHEEPYVVRGNNLTLQAGMTITIEPGVYIPDVIGVRIEEVVAVTADGVHVYGPMSPSVDDPFRDHL